MKKINHQCVQLKQNKPTQKEEKQIHINLLYIEEAQLANKYVQVTNRGNRAAAFSMAAEVEEKNMKTCLS